MCGLDLAHELLTCVCNRRPENSTWVSPKGHWLNLSETCLENLSQKLPFQTSVLLPGLMPVSSVAHGKNVRVFSHQSLLKPESPRTKSCPLLLLKSALCCPSLFITTSNAFLGLSPGLFPHLGLLLTWTLTWGLAHLDAHLEPCSPGCSPGPLLTWALAHLDAHLGPCSSGPLLTWATHCFKACFPSVCFLQHKQIDPLKRQLYSSDHAVPVNPSMTFHHSSVKFQICNLDIF